jgi:ABC-type multidrug transport system fused ATPase/permease subunit
MGEPGNQLDDATESEDKTVALLIAILALFLALSEAGGKKAEHLSTEKNIEASDLYNFYQAKKARATIVETADQALEALAPTVTDDKAREGVEKQIAAWKAVVARFENDPKKPEDSLEKIQDRANEANEARETSNHKLEHFEFASGALQISIVLASAAIITGVAALAWVAGLLGLVGAVLMAFGYFAPTVLTFLG